MFIDVAAGERNWRDLYKLCISFVTPRPIALLSSISPGGVPNLAPFSFYNMVCANPPIVMVSTGLHRDQRPKDTYVNVEQTREFVVATVTPAIARQMVDCAAELPYGESEFAFSKLTPRPATKVRPPLVAESPVNIECELREIKQFGGPDDGGIGPGGVSRLLFGRIVAIHVADELLAADGTCDPQRLTTVGRLGGAWYSNTLAPYPMEVPVVGR